MRQIAFGTVATLCDYNAVRQRCFDSYCILTL